MSDKKHAVLEIERARVEALLRHDVAALDHIMAEECVHTESNGTLRTKAQFLTAFVAQEFAFASFILDANEVRLYGDTAVVVIIAHGYNFSTLYGHLDDSVKPPPVRVGQMVNAGQIIGYVGMTGWTTGPHLHFMTIVNGRAVDPMPYLP